MWWPRILSVEWLAVFHDDVGAAFDQVAEPMPLAGQPSQQPVRGDESRTGGGGCGKGGLARDAAAKQRAEDETDEHIERRDPANAATFAEANDGQAGDKDHDRASGRLMRREAGRWGRRRRRGSAATG